jgi:signal transduction histidine kinase
MGLRTAVAILLGLAAEIVAFHWTEVVRWLPDLVAGWTLAGCGIAASSRQPGSRTGTLLYAGGLAWFAGNFAVVAAAPVAVASWHLTFLHRALLMHAVVTLPTGRVRSRSGVVAVVTGYVAWLASAPMPSVAATLAVGLVFVGSAGIDLGAAQPPARRVRTIALGVAVLLSATYLVAAVVHAVVPSGTANLGALLVDESGLIAAGPLVLYAVLLPALQEDRLTDLVVTLRGSRSDGVREALANILGDPSLEIGYWHPRSARYLDASGAPIDTGPGDGRRAITTIDSGHEGGAALIHDRALLQHAPLLESVRTTTRLATANARLRTGLLDQVSDVRASRRRLLAAIDAERDRLERRVEEGPVRSALAIEGAIAAMLEGDPLGSPHLRRAADALGRAVNDLRALEQGLHPRLLDEAGLRPALESLAAESATPVALDLTGDELPGEVKMACYYVCAEALANTAKHARATRVAIAVRQVDGDVAIEITDDGVGGADADGGSGLRSVTDRVEALGGRLSVNSEPGVGTSIRAWLPIASQP